LLQKRCFIKMFCINAKKNSLCQKMHIGKGIVGGLVEQVL